MSNRKKIKSKHIKKKQANRALRHGLPRTVKLIRGNKRPRIGPDYDGSGNSFSSMAQSLI